MKNLRVGYLSVTSWRIEADSPSTHRGRSEEMVRSAYYNYNYEFVITIAYDSLQFRILGKQNRYMWVFSKVYNVES